MIRDLNFFEFDTANDCNRNSQDPYAELRKIPEYNCNYDDNYEYEYNHSDDYNYNYVDDCSDDYVDDCNVEYTGIIDYKGDTYYSNGDIIKANGDIIFANGTMLKHNGEMIYANYKELNTNETNDSWTTLNDIDIKICHLSKIISLIPTYNNLSDYDAKKVLTNKIRHEFTNYDKLINISNDKYWYNKDLQTKSRNIIKNACLKTIGNVYKTLLEYCNEERRKLMDNILIKFNKDFIPDLLKLRS